MIRSRGQGRKFRLTREGGQLPLFRMGKKLNALVQIALLAILAACAGAPTPQAAEVPATAIVYLATPQVEACRMDLAGRREHRADWSDAAEAALIVAMVDALNARAIEVSLAGDAPTESLAVLPAAFRHAPGGAAPLPSTSRLEDWRVDLATREFDAPVILLAARADFTSGANQAAQVGLGIALLSPSLPAGGKRDHWAALADPVSGALLAVARVQGGDARNETEAREIAGRLTDALLPGARP